MTWEMMRYSYQIAIRKPTANRPSGGTSKVQERILKWILNEIVRKVVDNSNLIQDEVLSRGLVKHGQDINIFSNKRT